MPQTVHILFGFTEGYWHGNRLRQRLQAADYTIIDDAAAADILIAHSAGCYYVPDKLDPRQLLVLIDPPYWPQKTVAERSANMMLHMVKSVRRGNGPFYQVHKTLWNIGYLIRHHQTNRDMARLAGSFNLAEHISHPRTILVHNQHDPWLTADLDHLKLINPDLRIQHLPGGHDDCWLHPDRYVNLLQSEV